MYNPDLYLSNKFLMITGALETFHKKEFVNHNTIYKAKRRFVKRIKPLVIKAIKDNPETIDDLPKVEELIGYWNQPALSERIIEICNYYWEILSYLSIKIEDINCFAKKVSQYRNGHAHGYNLIEIEDYYDLFFTYKDIHILLYLCILSKLGFTNEYIKEVLHFDELKAIRESHNKMTFALLEPNMLIVLAWLKEYKIFCKLPKRLIEDLESLLKIIQNVQQCLDNDFTSIIQSSIEKDNNKSSFLSQYDQIKKDKLLNEINRINSEHIKKYWKDVCINDVSYISLALWCGCMSSLQLLKKANKQEWELFFSTIEKLSSENPVYGIGVELSLVWNFKNNKDIIVFEKISTHWHIRKYEKLFL